MISTSHKMGPLEISIGNLEVGNTPEDFGLAKDYFTSLSEK